jgi:uncharacterized membrane protein (DUF2068 family)
VSGQGPARGSTVRLVTTSSGPELTGGLSSEPARKPPLPVVCSFWILIASAALRVFIVVLTLASWNSLINQQLTNLPANTTVAQERAAMHTYLTFNVVLDLVFAALYVLFAYRIRSRRNWARLVITAIVVLFGLFDIFSGTDPITLVTILVELAAVALLYVPSAREYFAPAALS